MRALLSLIVGAAGAGDSSVTGGVRAASSIVAGEGRREGGAAGTVRGKSGAREGSRGQRRL